MILLTIAVSMGIFMNILDTSIANVAIPTIAGNLAVSANEGTWVITSFTVSMAIVLPLTGWLGKRFGEVRLFVTSTLMFTILSVLCALSNSLAMLIVCRVLQGVFAGPMIPLSQSLLIANYPDDKKGLATALWATVAVAAPVLGPILGGYITDNYSWPWIFYINVPIGLASVYLTWRILKNRETPTSQSSIDYIGLILLAVGVGSLQILLDRGQDSDWFNSNYIITLAILSLVTLTFLIIWELTENNPIIDLSLFKIRNFTLGTIAISLGYGTYFGTVVILPLWLQTQMNYTPTWAGLATATLGILPFILSPLMSIAMKLFDLRLLVSGGFLFFAFCSFWTSEFNTNVTIGEVALTRFIQGMGASLFFIPTISILLSRIDKKNLASAAGLSNFLRILAGSLGTSISVSLWDHRERIHQAQIAETVTAYHPNLKAAIQAFQIQGISLPSTYAKITQLMVNQAFSMATNDLFYLAGILFVALMILIWFSKPPFFIQEGGGIGH